MFWLYIFIQIVLWAIAISGLVGAFMVAFTREDAFPAADRQPKWVWMGILLGASLLVPLYTRISFLSLVGVVIIGIYWFDVRPQIKDILGGRYEY